jgi:hypothetical protein
MEEELHPAWETLKQKGGKKKKMVKRSPDNELFKKKPKNDFGNVSLDDNEEMVEEYEEVESKPKAKKREVTINFTLDPHKAMKWGLIALLIIMVFFAGRLTGGSSVETYEVATEGVTGDSSFVSSVSGFFTSLFADGESESLTGAAVVETDSEDVVEEESAEEVPVEEEVEEIPVEEAEEVVEESTEEEEIITTYNSVALAINDVQFDWKETWGKIIKLKYTIKNNEGGTIKPEYITIMVEGYPEEGSMKKAPLAPSSRTVKSKTAVSSVAAVTGGFSYSKTEIGDLSDVIVTAVLYDANGKLMTTYTKGFNLQG